MNTNGMNNIGNTCWMNSVIQILSNTPLLREYFISLDFFSNLHDKIKSESENSLKKYKEKMTNTISYQFYRLLLELYKNRGNIFPRDFKNVISLKNEIYRGYGQQDTLEFFTWLIDNLQDENEIEYKLLNIIPSEDELLSIEEGLFWKKFNNKSSPIKRLFYGTFISTLRCKSCNNKSIKFEPFSSLNLEIPESDNYLNLYDCLDNYVKEEDIEDKIYCEACDKKRKMKKIMKIFRLPEILVIGLKRFTKNDYGNVIDKNDEDIEYPIIGLRMEKYCESKDKKEYRLYGINIHQGKLNYGHYYSYCKNNFNGYWNEYNDSKVKPLVDTQDSDALILFYINTI